MPVPPRPISTEALAEGRRLYEETRVPVDDIAAMLGIGTRSFYTRVRKWGWRRRMLRIPQTDPPRDAAGPVTPVPPTSVTAQPETAIPALPAPPHPPEIGAVAVRIQRAVERELHAVEQIIARLRPIPEHTADAERAARVVASLARTLHEVARISAPQGEASRLEDDDDIGPAEPDEFIRELVRRMDEFARRRQDGVRADASGEVA